MPPGSESYTVEVKIDDAKARVVIDRLTQQLTSLNRLANFGVGGGGAATPSGPGVGRAPGRMPGPATSAAGAAGTGGFMVQQPGQVPGQGAGPGAGYAVPMSRSASIFGSAIAPWSGLPGAAMSEMDTPFSTAISRGVVSGVAGTAGAVGAAFGPAGAIAGAGLGLIGGAINAVLQRRERIQQALASQTPSLAAYQRSVGLAMQGGAGRGMWVDDKAYANAIHQGVLSKINALDRAQKQYSGRDMTSEERKDAAIQIKATYDPHELAIAGGIGTNMTPSGYPAMEAAGMVKEYAAGIGFKNYGVKGAPGWHEAPFEYTMATAGIGAMARFKGLRAGGAGGAGMIRPWGDKRPSVMGDLIAQAVTQGLRFARVDEYLNLISNGVTQLGQQGLTANLGNIADFTRSLMMAGYEDPAIAKTIGSSARMGMRAPRIAAGLLGGISGGYEQILSPFKQALPGFALAAAAQRMEGGGILGLAGGFARLAREGPGALFGAIPEGMRAEMLLAMGAAPEDIDAIAQGLEPGDPLTIPPEFKSKAKGGMALTGAAARGQAAAIASAVGMTNKILREQFTKQLGMLGDARDYMNETASGLRALGMMMERQFKGRPGEFEKTVDKLVNRNKKRH